MAVFHAETQPRSRECNSRSTRDHAEQFAYLFWLQALPAHVGAAQRNGERCARHGFDGVVKPSASQNPSA
jgi:hypothetical protein